MSNEIIIIFTFFLDFFEAWFIIQCFFIFMILIPKITHKQYKNNGDSYTTNSHFNLMLKLNDLLHFYLIIIFLYACTVWSPPALPIMHTRLFITVTITRIGFFTDVEAVTWCTVPWFPMNLGLGGGQQGAEKED